MRSLRLDEEFDARVRRAAEVEHESVSEFLRKAAAARVDAVLSKADGAMTNSERLADVIGSVRGAGGGDARRTHAAFGEIVEAKHTRRRRTVT